MVEVQAEDTFISDRVKSDAQCIAEMACRDPQVLVRSSMRMVDASTCWPGCKTGMLAQDGCVADKSGPTRRCCGSLTVHTRAHAGRRPGTKAGSAHKRLMEPAGCSSYEPSLPQAQWNAAQRQALSRSRWHVEPPFTRFKQL